ncbi:MarR family winged helix-turn-helix transcriptional regulator [Rudanella lutea]|uniref:MarR family winged helix-turn-helix transcriptional regulator n=1 Tax=Rudanella lutea TaxID=451374 RepID=UPI0005C584BB|nr:MarR family transcriptional regulator [Rudanella lutea]
MVLDRDKELKANFASKMGHLSIFMISQAGHLIVRQTNRELSRMGFALQMEQLPILLIIYFADADLLSQQEIANALQKDKSGVQRSLRTLERDGYLRIVADSADRRKNLIQLTPAGKLVVDKAIETAGEINKRLTEQLTTEELDTFQATLRKIISLFDQ